MAKKFRCESCREWVSKMRMIVHLKACDPEGYRKLRDDANDRGLAGSTVEQVSRDLSISQNTVRTMQEEAQAELRNGKYKCDVCDMTFITEHGLKIHHIRTHGAMCERNEVILEAINDGAQVSEIADALGMTAKAVRMAIYRSRKR